MKHVLPILAFIAFTACADTNAPAADDLQRMKLELEVDRAKFEAERARFEAEKAKWEAQRAAQSTSQPSLTLVVTNAPQEPLYIAVEPVRLYRRGQIAGELSAGAIVTGGPHPQQRDWLIVKKNGVSYEAAAKSFGDAMAMLADAKLRASTAKARCDAAQNQIDEMQSRRTRLEQQITLLDATRQQTVVVVAPPQPTNHATNQQQILVFNNDPAASQVMHLRGELHDAERDLARLQKQMPALTQEQYRADDALQKLRQQIDAARNSAP